MIKSILKKFGYYKIEDLQSTGHCGICGKVIYEIFYKYHATGICQECKDRRQKAIDEFHLQIGMSLGGLYKNKI